MKLPMHRSGDCGVNCRIEIDGLPRCQSLCQALRWEKVDAASPEGEREGEVA